MPKAKAPPNGHKHDQHHQTNNPNPMPDNVKIKRVKRNKKTITGKEKLLAGIGVGGALMGAAGSVAPKSPTTKIVSTQQQGGANAGLKNTLGKIFKGAYEATIGPKTAKANADDGEDEYGMPSPDEYDPGTTGGGPIGGSYSGHTVGDPGTTADGQPGTWVQDETGAWYVQPDYVSTTTQTSTDHTVGDPGTTSDGQPGTWQQDETGAWFVQPDYVSTTTTTTTQTQTSTDHTVGDPGTTADGQPGTWQQDETGAWFVQPDSTSTTTTTTTQTQTSTDHTVGDPGTTADGQPGTWVQDETGAWYVQPNSTSTTTTTTTTTQTLTDHTVGDPGTTSDGQPGIWVQDETGAWYVQPNSTSTTTTTTTQTQALTSTDHTVGDPGTTADGQPGTWQQDETGAWFVQPDYVSTTTTPPNTISPNIGGVNPTHRTDPETGKTIYTYDGVDYITGDDGMLHQVSGTTVTTSFVPVTTVSSQNPTTLTNSNTPSGNQHQDAAGNTYYDNAPGSVYPYVDANGNQGYLSGSVFIVAQPAVAAPATNAYSNQSPAGYLPDGTPYYSVPANGYAYSTTSGQPVYLSGNYPSIVGSANTNTTPANVPSSVTNLIVYDSTPVNLNGQQGTITANPDGSYTFTPPTGPATTFNNINDLSQNNITDLSAGGMIGDTSTLLNTGGSQTPPRSTLDATHGGPVIVDVTHTAETPPRSTLDATHSGPVIVDNASGSMTIDTHAGTSTGPSMDANFGGPVGGVAPIAGSAAAIADTQAVTNLSTISSTQQINASPPILNPDGTYTINLVDQTGQAIIGADGKAVSVTGSSVADISSKIQVYNTGNNADNSDKVFAALVGGLRQIEGIQDPSGLTAASIKQAFSATPPVAPTQGNGAPFTNAQLTAGQASHPSFESWLAANISQYPAIQTYFQNNPSLSINSVQSVDQFITIAQQASLQTGKSDMLNQVWQASSQYDQSIANTNANYETMLAYNNALANSQAHSGTVAAPAPVTLLPTTPSNVTGTGGATGPTIVPGASVNNVPTSVTLTNNSTGNTKTLNVGDTITVTITGPAGAPVYAATDGINTTPQLMGYIGADGTPLQIQKTVGASDANGNGQWNEHWTVGTSTQQMNLSFNVANPSTATPPAAAATVIFNNGYGGQTYEAGHIWQLAITGAAPNAPVYGVGSKDGGASGKSQILGYTDASGNFGPFNSQVLTNAESGQWDVQFMVGNTAVGNPQSFYVAPAATNPLTNANVTQTFQNNLTVTFSNGQTSPLNQANYATKEAAQAIANMYGGVVVSSPVTLNGVTPSANATSQYAIQFPDGTVINAGTLALYFVNNPPDTANIYVTNAIAAAQAQAHGGTYQSQGLNATYTGGFTTNIVNGASYNVSSRQGWSILLHGKVGDHVWVKGGKSAPGSSVVDNNTGWIDKGVITNADGSFYLTGNFSGEDLVNGGTANWSENWATGATPPTSTTQTSPLNFTLNP